MRAFLSACIGVLLMPYHVSALWLVARGLWLVALGLLLVAFARSLFSRTAHHPAWSAARSTRQQPIALAASVGIRADAD